MIFVGQYTTLSTKMGGWVHTVACKYCGTTTQYETGGDAYCRGYGLIHPRCDCRKMESEKCIEIMKSRLPIKISVFDGGAKFDYGDVSITFSDSDLYGTFTRDSFVQFDRAKTDTDW